MKKCIVVFMLVLLASIGFCSPAHPQDKEFIAVYSDPTFTKYWSFYKVDYLQEAKTWDDFPGFIKVVKEQAKNRPIVIDINVHGTREGLLSIYHNKNCIHGRKDKSYLSTFGYVLKEISTIGEDKIKMVLFESCYGGYVYFKSREGYKESYRGGNRYDSYSGIAPYPIYGVDNCVNWNNAIFMQLASGDNVNFFDLRQFSKVPPAGELGNGKSPKSQAIYWYVQYQKQKIIAKTIKALLNLTDK